MTPISFSAVEMRQLWHQLNREMHTLFGRTAHDGSLPRMAAVLLHHIGKHGGVSVSELARRSHAAKSYVSNLVDQLVERGLVEKRQDADDQRIVRLYTTDVGSAKLAETEVRIEAAWQQVIEYIPDDERDDVGRVIRALVRAFARANALCPDRAQSGGGRSEGGADGGEARAESVGGVGSESDDGDTRRG